MTEEEWGYILTDYTLAIFDKANSGKISEEKALRLVGKLDEWEDEYYRRKKEMFG